MSRKNSLLIIYYVKIKTHEGLVQGQTNWPLEQNREPGKNPGIWGPGMRRGACKSERSDGRSTNGASIFAYLVGVWAIISLLSSHPNVNSKLTVNLHMKK